MAVCLRVEDLQHTIHNFQSGKELHAVVNDLKYECHLVHFFVEYVTDEDWERPTDMKTITDNNAKTMFLTELIRGFDCILV